MPPIIPVPTDVPENGHGNNSMENEDTNVINVISDSESISDDENPTYDGYEPLSQDPETYIDNQSDFPEEGNYLTEDHAQSIEVNILNHHSLLLSAPSTGIEREIAGSTEQIKMDEEQIETIKSVMKNVTLPSSNLPQWATIVPEEEWKTTLFSELLQKKCNKSSGNSNSHTFSSNDNSTIPR